MDRIETYEQPEIKPIIKESSAKTVKGLLKGKIQIAKNAGNIYLQTIYEDLLNEVERIQPKKTYEMVSGWKGKSDLIIYQGLDENIFMTSHEKNKETGEVKEITTEVDKENINALLKVIRTLPLGVKYSCYDIVNLMGYDWKNDVWKNRTSVYFPKYYFPCKFLESIKVIQYFGRGSIKRLI